MNEFQFALDTNSVSKEPVAIYWQDQLVLNLETNSPMNQLFAQDVVNCLNRTATCRSKLAEAVDKYRGNRLQSLSGGRFKPVPTPYTAEWHAERNKPMWTDSPQNPNQTEATYYNPSQAGC